MKSETEAWVAVRDLLRTSWTQGEYEDEGRYCLMGAVSKVAVGDAQALDSGFDGDHYADDFRLGVAMVRHLANKMTRAGVLEGSPFGLTDGDRIVRWNDQGGRELSEVLAAVSLMLVGHDAAVQEEQKTWPGWPDRGDR